MLRFHVGVSWIHLSEWNLLLSAVVWAIHSVPTEVGTVYRRCPARNHRCVLMPMMASRQRANPCWCGSGCGYVKLLWSACALLVVCWDTEVLVLPRSQTRGLELKDLEGTSMSQHTTTSRDMTKSMHEHSTTTSHYPRTAPTGLALCLDAILGITTHLWVPASHPRYTGAHLGATDSGQQVFPLWPRPAWPRPTLARPILATVI